MPIIATAGHVDHGKSTLVLALTGRDPDRWAEEKERGLTIDLGFAWTRLGDDEVGLVDVPGHERFIKNMLAGMGSVDVALFVVAADEGWMPQSEEHLGVLDALGVANGVIALTRSDLVDDELRELAVAEVEDRVAETTAATWPVVAVAAPNGTGLDELRQELTAALGRAARPEDIGRPRLWVDRAFTIEGAGLVVTGTLVDGSLSTEQPIELWPGPTAARIRTLQTHDQAASAVPPGSRVAVNLTSADRSDIARGAMLSTDGAFRTTSRVHAQLRPVRGLDDALANRGAYHLHAGSGHWPATLQVIGSAGGASHAIVRLAEPVPLRMGDRFILREVGRRTVVAGGRILDPHPGRGLPRDDDAELLAASLEPTGARHLDRTAMADALLQRRGFESARNIDVDTGGGTTRGSERLGSYVATAEWVESRLERLRSMTDEFHEGNPMRPGIPKATLASRSGHEVVVIDGLVRRDESGLEEDGPTVRRVGHSVERTASQDAAWAAAQTTLRQAGFAVPRSSTLELDTELFHALVRNGELVAVAGDLAYLPDQIEAITKELGELGDGFTVAQFRDRLGVSRRHAVPLLEWLDKAGLTVRRGDIRMLGPTRAE